MQNKGAIITFAVLLAAVCLYQLSFTLISRNVEKDAKVYANGNRVKEAIYLDSISGVTVYNLGFKKFTYKDVKEQEMNLGLDLKGGMNVTLEVSVIDLIRAMSNYSTDSTFNKALARATELQRNSTQDFVTLFGQAFSQVDPNARLASIFNTLELRDKVNFNSTNDDVLKIIRTETDAAIDNSYNILRTRIDRFGVAQPNIQQLQTKGRILVELPGVDNPERVRKLLQGTAMLEFWETYENQEIYTYMLQANQKVKDIQNLALASATTSDSTSTVTSAEAKADTTGKKSLLSELESAAKTDTTSKNLQNLETFRKEYPLFAILTPTTDQSGNLMRGPIAGTAHSKDTGRVNEYLKMEQIRSIFPRNLIFKWTAKPIDEAGNYFRLIALKSTTRDGRPPLDGDVITDARQDFDQMGGRPEVSMSMNSEGAKVWQRLTKDNIGKSIAIVLDGYIRSFPTVQNEISGGRSSITGLENIEEAKDLANILKSGKMPAPARIIQEEIVGPSLGREAIRSGFFSFVIAFLLVLGYMLFFYSQRAGLAANAALLFNVFFLIGVLASLGAVLTLPGIAGIVLTMGMAVDANVLIYERTVDELNAGKGLRLAIADGYKNAYSAIIDGQLTTILTGIILYIFGSGPIKGFATTLIIGILTSLFTAIFFTRIIFEWMLGKNKKITFYTNLTKTWLNNTKIKFIENRRYLYIASATLSVISIGSLAIRGMSFGIDFKGGRTYVVKFDQDVRVADVQRTLTGAFGTAPEVKTFGANNQVRITTIYKVEDMSENIDNEVEGKLLTGLQDGGFISKDVTMEEFTAKYRQSSQKVGPTISDDIKRDAAIAIFFALIGIFIYIFIRFKNWQYGLGGVASLVHDSLMVLGIFSLGYGILPFSLDVDQAFIAAILTVIGYSINDTVIVFDRIREYLRIHPKRELSTNMNDAMNHTLRRTFNTSMTTLVVLIAIFLFGGETIRGFIFALLIGIGVGTYSSFFVATPIAYDTQRRLNKFLKK